MDLTKPPATLEEIEEEELNNLKKYLRRLYDIWGEFGITEEQKIERAQITWTHISTLMEDIFNEENSLYEEIKNRIQEYTKHVIELSEILDVTPKFNNTVSLVKQEEHLRLELFNLTQLKHTRLKSLEDLRSVESKLCSFLRIEEHKLSTPNGVPSEKDLKEIEQHISLLRKERDRRFKKFCVFRMELSTILEVTELCPETPLEKSVHSGIITSLSDESLKAVEEAVNKAQKKKEDMENQKKGILLKLSALWDLLRVPDSKRTEFLSRHQDCKITTLNSLRHELEQYEKIKKDNIKIYVDNMREKLKTLWDNCFVTECERDHFSIYYSKDISDEVLEVYESEIEKWENYYEKIKSIATKIDKRRKLWDLLLVFENKASDPNRFKNRKGNLLKEEKERKKLQKDLPALEKEIFCEIDLHDSTYSKPFLYFGQDYRSFVTNQWQERMSHKENERTDRQKQRLLQTETEINLGTSATRQLTTPKSASSKLFKSCRDGSVCHTPTADKSMGNPYSIVKSVLAINKLVNSAQKSSVSYKLFSSVSPRPKVIMKRDQERNKSRKAGNMADEPNLTPRRSAVLSSKKVGGTRISIISTKKIRKSTSKAFTKTSPIPVRSTNNSINTPNLTPRRGSVLSSKKCSGTRIPVSSTKKPRKFVSKTTPSTSKTTPRTSKTTPSTSKNTPSTSKNTPSTKLFSKSTTSASKTVSKSTFSASKAASKLTVSASKTVSKSRPSLTSARGQPGLPFLI